MRKSAQILVPFLILFLPCSAFTTQPFELATQITPPGAFDWMGLYVDDQYIYGCEAGVRIYNRSNFSFNTLLTVGDSIWLDAVHADDTYIYSGGSDNKLYVWDRDTFALNTILTDSTESIYSVFSDDDYIYAGGGDDNVYVWSRSNLALFTVLTDSQPLVHISAVHADSSFIYAGGEDAVIYVWDRATFALNTILTDAYLTSYDDVVAIHTKPGTYIYAASKNDNIQQGYVWRWDWSTLTPEGDVTAGVELNDMFVGDTYIFGAGEDHNIYVWDRMTFDFVRLLTPPVHDPVAVFETVFADDLYIYGGSEALVPNDENLYIWYLRAPPGQTVLGTIKNKNGDQNLYQYYAPEPFDPFIANSGDWVYWDAAARNPSPGFQAKDLWIVPQGNDIVAAAPVDIDGDGYDEVAVMKNTGGDYNFYVYNSLEMNHDTSYWAALARNPSPLARDFWFIPAGNNTIMMAGVDTDGDGIDEIAILKNERGTQALYYYNAPAPGEYYWPQAFARNGLGPYAYDAWYVPGGSNIVAMAAADGKDDGATIDQVVTVKNEGGNYNLYVWKAPPVGGLYNTESTNRFLQAGFTTPEDPIGFGKPQAQDTFIIPQRDDIVSITAVRSDDGTYDALGVMENYYGDYNYYLWKLPVFPEHTYDDVLYRQYGRNHFGTPQARDFWIIPSSSMGTTEHLLGIVK